MKKREVVLSFEGLDLPEEFMVQIHNNLKEVALREIAQWDGGGVTVEDVVNAGDFKWGIVVRGRGE